MSIRKSQWESRAGTANRQPPRAQGRTRSPVSLALVELRNHIGETQQEFSNRLHVSLPTVGNWETLTPPRTFEALTMLATVAAEANREDLAKIFTQELEAQSTSLKSQLAQKEAYRRLVLLGATDPFGLRFTFDRVAAECALLRSKKNKELQEIADRIESAIHDFVRGNPQGEK